MTVEKFQLLALRGAVTELPKEEQQRITEIKDAIQRLVKDGGQSGCVALSLVALEIAAEEQA